jgi:hypothetical protein
LCDKVVEVKRMGSPHHHAPLFCAIPTQLLRSKARVLVRSLRKTHPLVKKEVKRNHQHHQQEALQSLLPLLLLQETNKDPHDLVLPAIRAHMDLTSLTLPMKGHPHLPLKGHPHLPLKGHPHLPLKGHPHLPRGANHRNLPQVMNLSNLRVHDRYASNLLSIKSYTSTAFKF